ncbi:MAG: MutH/Sau3AI family endonuclease [Persephonella sp.]|nr:MutH/Sau3AI family endonuclease [Persephonella sp.]
MERKEALRKGKSLIGKDLRTLADELGITVFREGKKNKGWAGHVIERYLGLPLNSAQSPNFGSWELKLVSLKYLKTGELTVKETMAITMIDAYNVLNTPFEESHLLQKLKKMLIFARIWEGKNEPRSILYGVYEFDLTNKELYEQIKKDYELVRKTIKEKGFNALTGKIGVYIQPRTKGTGHGSTTRAFYARKNLLKKIIFGK